MTPKIFLFTILLGTHQVVLSQLQTASKGVPATAVTVPFIGCSADGQVGPLGRPKGGSKVVHVPKENAEHLAFYKAEEGFGVLAPRGWHCFATYGSSGASLFVSPESIDGKTLFSDTWKGFTGPVVQLSVEDGGTSGRFGVAQTIARVFPSHRAFVRKVISEGIEPASDFPSGPYPKDQLDYKSKELVEYQTPAQTEGLGTQSRLLKDADPIRGVAILVGLEEEGEPSLLFLASRLPSEMTNLTSAIIQQTEYDAAHPED